jgi:hypothetical protein
LFHKFVNLFLPYPELSLRGSVGQVLRYLQYRRREVLYGQTDAIALSVRFSNVSGEGLGGLGEHVGLSGVRAIEHVPLQFLTVSLELRLSDDRLLKARRPFPCGILPVTFELVDSFSPDSPFSPFSAMVLGLC